MRRRGSEYWLLGALVALLFHKPLTTATFYFRDLYLLFYPKHLLLTAAIRARELPLWDPLTHGGQPYLATPSNAFYQPFNLLYFALPPIWAFNIAIVMQFALAAAGACWLARRCGLSRAASFTAGAVFAFCGYTLSAANLLVIFSLPAFPFAIAFIDVAIRERKRWAFVAAGVAIAWPLWSGGAEAAACLIVTIGFWVLAIRPGRRSIASVIVIGVLGVALSAMAIVPAMEVIRNSSRSGQRPFERFTAWSVDPRRLPELVVPQFLGRTDRLDEREFWGQNLETENFPYMLSLYFGALTLLLAGSGARNRANRLPRKTLAALAIAGLLLSLGRWLPLLRALYELVPLIGTFRFPVKAITLALLPIALLTGSGIDRTREEPRRMLQWTVGIIAVSMCLLSILFASSSAFVQLFARAFFGQAATPFLRTGLAVSFFHAALVPALAAAVLTWQRARAATLLAAIIAIDLLTAGWSVNAFAPRAIYDPPSFLPQVRSLVGSGRLYRDPIPKPLALRAPSDDIMWIARWKIESLSGYTAAMFGVPVIFHDDWDQLAPRRVAELTDVVARAPWPVKLRLLESGGVQAVITHVPLPESANVVEVARMQTAEAHPLFVYSLRSSAPARFVSSAIVASTAREAIAQAVEHADANTIVLEESGSGGKCGSASVTLLSKSLNASRWSVDAPCNGYVYFSDTWFPGWGARVDGSDAQVIRANYAFSAVAVTRGKHIIEKVYAPRLPLIGAGASLLALIALIATSAFWRF